MTDADAQNTQPESTIRAGREIAVESCSGCHIALTAQHENIVRKGERLTFCEHCSRIHYWQESEAIEGTAVATKKRRRRAATSI